MNRRLFIKISSFSLLPLLNDGCRQRDKTGFEITVHNDMPVGHLTHESNDYTTGDKLQTDFLVIGGGLAGLSAAYELRDKDYILIELSDRLGGTSTAESYKGLIMAQGAHYDLAYPDYFGKEGIKLLESLGIIKYNAFSKLYDFTDRHYLIDPRIKENCLCKGTYRDDVLPEGPERIRFSNILREYTGSMPLPTRLIREDLRYLNNESFLDFLEERMELSRDMKTGIDYNMRDDYGASSEHISALAGIHYYACRPYYTQPVPLLSPPEGNYYFVRKIAEVLDKNRILLQHLGMSIQKTGEGFETRVADVQQKKIHTIRSNRIVYAGQKHALEYVFPEDYAIFQDIEYAPWMIVNLVLKSREAYDAYWQNEMPGRHPHLIGFVDASAQNIQDESNHTFISVYYNLRPEERELLEGIELIASKIAEDSMKYVGEFFGKKISNMVEKVFIKVMGHAMPIPAPGYLFNDRNDNREEENLVYAGVDNSRLPLLFEAIDSGIMAAEILL